MIPSELAALNAAFEGQPAEDILRAAAERFAPRITFSTGFGAEGCVIIDLIARHQLPIEVCTLDTGLLFPETYELWKALEARYGLRIRAVTPEQSVDEQAREHGPALWERDPDRCCALRKVDPLKKALGGFDAWVTAIRRDQTQARRSAKLFENDPTWQLVKVNPLAAWSNKNVWDHLLEHGVPYNPLHDRGYTSIGCAPCTTPVAEGEDARSGRWRGRQKTECGLHAATSTSSVGSTAPAASAATAGATETADATATAGAIPAGAATALVTHGDRSAVSSMARRGFIVWFTGMSGAGKSTLSQALQSALREVRPVEVLDGDEVRTFLSRGLGFSREDRDTNVLRIGFVARLLARHGAAVVTAAISPYRETREAVRRAAEAEGIPFIEVHAHAELDALVRRDVKGLYRRALAGELPSFTGVSDPYEPPTAADVTVRSDLEAPAQSLERILAALSDRGLIPPRTVAA